MYYYDNLDNKYYIFKFCHLSTQNDDAKALGNFVTKFLRNYQKQHAIMEVNQILRKFNPDRVNWMRSSSPITHESTQFLMQTRKIKYQLICKV